MKKAVIIAVLLSSLIQGCALFQKKPPANIITDTVVQIDPKALEPCAPLVLMDPQNPDILDNVAKNAEIYAACAIKQDNSIVLLKKFANTKEHK